MGPVRLLFRTVRLDHALRLLPRDLHCIVKARARLGLVDYHDVCDEFPEERLRRVFAASGKIDGRSARDFFWMQLTMGEIARLFPGRVGAISDAVTASWEYAA